MARLNDPEYARLIDKARRTNGRRDHFDRSVGFAAPGDAAPREDVRTVLAALEAGIRLQDWDCVAEGYVMLSDFIARQRWAE